MSDVRDMTSQMAKELMLGIKDNVEDVAAAFKKMAIINPDRHQSAPALPEPGEQETEQTATVAVIAAPVRPAKISPETAAYYAALLEEQNRKKKPKKVAVDENQLTLFDFVA